MVKTITVVMVDDHALVREGLRLLLQHVEGVKIVGEADNGRDALAVVKKLKPDVVLLDIVLPLLNGIDVARQIKEEFPFVWVLMLTAYSDEEYVLKALRAGASGFLIKDATVREFELALRAVSRGETYICPRAVRHVVAELLRGVAGKSVDALTIRQREILQLIAEGHTTKEIVTKLSLSHKTIETHRGELMTRLGVHDIAGLTRCAIQKGLIRVEKNVA